MYPWLLYNKPAILRFARGGQRGELSSYCWHRRVKTNECFGFLGIMLYLCTRSGAIIWLVAHLRVFIEQFIAERGIEYGLQIVTRKFLNPPDCLYLKKSCKFLQSYKKFLKLERFLTNFFDLRSHEKNITGQRGRHDVLMNSHQQVLDLRAANPRFVGDKSRIY